MPVGKAVALVNKTAVLPYKSVALPYKTAVLPYKNDVVVNNNVVLVRKNGGFPSLSPDFWPFPAIFQRNLLTGHVPGRADFSLSRAFLSEPLDWANLVRFSYLIDNTVISSFPAPYFFDMPIGGGKTEIEIGR